MPETTRFYRSPNDSPRDGTIHGIAIEQLAAYQTQAKDWPRYPDGSYVRCGHCNQALWRTYDDDGTPFRYEGHEKIALTVAHIRQRHAEVVSNAVD